MFALDQEASFPSLSNLTPGLYPPTMVFYAFIHHATPESLEVKSLDSEIILQDDLNPLLLLISGDCMHVTYADPFHSMPHFLLCKVGVIIACLEGCLSQCVNTGAGLGLLWTRCCAYLLAPLWEQSSVST